jgi:hypothetical protein
MYSFINNINGNYKISGSNKPKFIPTRRNHIETQYEAKTFALFSQPYLDTYNQCYKNIVVINLFPKGPLAEFVKFVKFPPLSKFKESTPGSLIKDCGYALHSFGRNENELMVVDEIPDLISYLASNGYTIDTNITKMFNGSDIQFNTNEGNKLICFITYNN